MKLSHNSETARLMMMMSMMSGALQEGLARAEADAQAPTDAAALLRAWRGVDAAQDRTVLIRTRRSRRRRRSSH